MRMLGTTIPTQPPPTPPPPDNLPPTPVYTLWQTRNPSLSPPAWLHALVLVTFDIDHGQQVDAVYPSNLLTADQLEHVAVLAMPDSAACGHGMEDLYYSFRIPQPHQAPAVLLAHVLFRQRPDHRNARGFFQKAIVLVTCLPFLGLFHTILHVLGEQVLEKGEVALRDVWAYIANWPPIHHVEGGAHIRLTLGETILRLHVPDSWMRSFAAPAVEIEGNPSTGDSRRMIRKWPLGDARMAETVAWFHEVDLGMALRGVHDKVPVLWELVALGEPLLVHGVTPAQCAAAVMAVVGLVHPLPFVGEWRPYMCIQDEAWREVVGGGRKDGGVYGVTNGHLVGLLKFPHVLTLGSVPGVVGRGKVGLESPHKTSLHRSKQLVGLMGRAVTEGEKSGGNGGSRLGAEVRACVFNRITRPFLRAFDRYLVPTWGSGRSVTEEPYASDPFGRKLGLVELELDRFPTPEDLASPGVVALFKPGAVSKNRVKVLYKRFVNGPVFKMWWKSARSAAEKECIVLHKTDVMEACMRGVGRVGGNRGEKIDSARVERVVELWSRIQVELSGLTKEEYVLRGKLEEISGLVASSMPADVQRRRIGKVHEGT